MKQADPRNLSMVMDLYELTMANGYFNDGDIETRVAFDVFFRKIAERGGYRFFAGLVQIVGSQRRMWRTCARSIPLQKPFWNI